MRRSASKASKRCDACNVAIINGVRCHELGCNEAWRDCERECRECGGAFRPEHSLQLFCENACYASHYGIGSECEEDAR